MIISLSTSALLKRLALAFWEVFSFMAAFTIIGLTLLIIFTAKESAISVLYVAQTVWVLLIIASIPITILSAYRFFQENKKKNTPIVLLRSANFYRFFWSSVLPGLLHLVLLP